MIFRKAHEVLKKALEMMPFDGYVTDNTEITREISRLYGNAIILEKEASRIEAIKLRQI